MIVLIRRHILYDIHEDIWVDKSIIGVLDGGHYATRNHHPKHISSYIIGHHQQDKNMIIGLPC